MIFNLKTTLIIFLFVIITDFSNGFKCFDDSDSKNDCSCLNGYCSCTGLSVRNGIPCNVIGSIDSVGFYYLENIIKKGVFYSIGNRDPKNIRSRPSWVETFY